jgi:hypothetical protein
MEDSIMKMEEKAQRAFNIMMSDNPTVRLSKQGKEAMDKPARTECSPGDFDSQLVEPDLTLKKDAWEITAVHCDGNINIVCNDTHFVMTDCPAEWFIFN